jgi:hypothetical protein
MPYLSCSVSTYPLGECVHYTLTIDAQAWAIGVHDLKWMSTKNYVCNVLFQDLKIVSIVQAQ